jgi:type IV pilus assembly protein PilW
MKPIKLLKLQTGISMIEIMIAMLIGIFLTGGLIQMFITSKNTNKLQDAVSRVQENGRFAVEFITEDVRMADYFMECSTASKDLLAVTGTDNDTTDPNIIDGTDTITVRQTTGACDSRQTTAVTYSIRTGANGGPSLYKQINNAAPQELVEGVEQMQILYGVDTDTSAADRAEYGVPDYYVPANVVASNTNWDDVLAIKISLLVRSDNKVTSDTSPDTYNAYRAYNSLPASVMPDLDTCGTTNAATCDTRMRRMYNSTIAVRNRIN